MNVWRDDLTSGDETSLNNIYGRWIFMATKRFIKLALSKGVLFNLKLNQINIQFIN